MTLKEKKEKILQIIKLMENKYPDAVCSLTADTPFQLLVATRLSAQCTDARVNLITPALFKKFPNPNPADSTTLRLKI